MSEMGTTAKWGEEEFRGREAEGTERQPPISETRTPSQRQPHEGERVGGTADKERSEVVRRRPQIRLLIRNVRESTLEESHQSVVECVSDIKGSDWPFIYRPDVEGRQVPNEGAATGGLSSRTRPGGLIFNSDPAIFVGEAGEADNYQLPLTEAVDYVVGSMCVCVCSCVIKSCGLNISKTTGPIFTKLEHNV